MQMQNHKIAIRTIQLQKCKKKTKYVAKIKQKKVWDYKQKKLLEKDTLKDV